MAKGKDSGNIAWFLAGITVGAVTAILFAPKSGREARDSLADAASRGKDFAGRKGRDVAEFGREVLDQGKSFATEARDAGKEAVDLGKKIIADLAPKRGDGSATEA